MNRKIVVVLTALVFGVFLWFLITGLMPKDVLYMFVLGIISWFATGIDDLMIFASNYRAAKSKLMSILGVMTAVSLMIALVLTGGIGLKFIGDWTFVGFCIPFYLAYKTFKNGDDDAETRIGASFTVAFMGFALNCTDDISYNLSVILIEPFASQVAFLVGVFVGSLLMVCVSIGMGKVRDFPYLRGLVLFAVSDYILWSGLQDIIPGQTDAVCFGLFPLVVISFISRAISTKS